MVKRIMFAALCIGLMASSASTRTARLSERDIQFMAAGVPADPSVVGYLNLHKRHPTAAEGAVEFEYDYSSTQALRRLTQMQSFLASFAELTKRARSTLTAAELSAVGNTGAEMQTIGFHNIPLIVEGTLLKQDYQLRQAQYELAQLKLERGEISAEELDRARRAYHDATKKLQVFWDTKLPTD